jgi:hypothetical protein
MTGNNEEYQQEKCSFARERNTGNNNGCRISNF